MANEVKAKLQSQPKKVTPYPFEAILDHNGAKVPVEVLYVSEKGLIARIAKVFLHVGEYFQIQCELPGVERSLFTRVRVLKTYDKSVIEKDRKVERMAEFHFEKLSDDHKQYLSVFFTTFGLKK